MELAIRIKMNDKLFLRNPEDSVLGKKIVKQGLVLINKLGYEDFTFKKLAETIDTTEASIYRYFENKHRFLVYLFSWYWSFLEYKLMFETNNILNTESKLKTMIKLLVEEPNLSYNNTDFINEKEVYKLIMQEGSKAYLTSKITSDNENKLFKPFKDLCACFSDMIKQYNPKYKFPHSLATTIIEMSHSQKYFATNLPALTDFKPNEDKKIIHFLEQLLFEAIKK